MNTTLEKLLIDIRELSHLLGRSIASLERDRTAKRLPQQIRLGGSVYWKRSEILDWIAAGCPCLEIWANRMTFN